MKHETECSLRSRLWLPDNTVLHNYKDMHANLVYRLSQILRRENILEREGEENE
jgi:hypothetical protein